MGKSETVSGVDVGNVTGWIQQRVPSLAPPLRFDLIAGGLSNLSYRVTDGTGTRWVLRRPPLGHVLATAHDMSREFKIIDALATTNVPVPPLVGLCTDDAVNGAPFYVMDFVDGVIARDRTSADSLSPEARRRSGESLVEVLAAIHAVDIDACGLGDLGRKEAYVERQISRWTRQWEATRDGDVPVMEELSTRLAAAIPEQGPATIVHGDYRLDNLLIDEADAVTAVLDWEMATIGDALTDLALMLAYHRMARLEAGAVIASASNAEGFLTEDGILEAYARRSGNDLEHVGFYLGLAYYKLAGILEGIYFRHLGGQTVGAGFDRLGSLTEPLIQAGIASCKGSSR